MSGECLVTIAGDASVKWLAYFASGLTGLADDQRAMLQRDAVSVRRACEGIQAYLYEPAEFTDPVKNENLTPERVYEIDHAQVTRSHFLVLDARFPSFGAGQEIEIAMNGGIPIVLLKPKRMKVSRMVTGTFARLFIVEFESADQLDAGLDARFTELVAELANLHRIEAFAFVSKSDGDESLGARLRRIRSGMRLDEVTVARLVGLAPHAIRQFEEDLGNPSVTHLHRLAAVLKTSVAHLVEGVATRPEETDPVLRKSKDSLHAFAEKRGLSHTDVNQLWKSHVELYSSQRQSVAEARTEPLSENDWEKRHRESKPNGKAATQARMFDD